MLPQGTLSGTADHTSFARYAGLLMVCATIVLVFALTAMLAFMDICNPELLGTEIHEVCKRRFESGGLAAYMTAGGGVLTACTVFLYRENKKAETRNGG
jgi:hypothetical protein